MSIAARPRPLTTRPRWLGMAGWQALGHWFAFAGFLLVAALVAVVVLVVISRSRTPTGSGVQIGMWVPFAVAAHFTGSWLGPHVSAGMTRRSFVRASVLAAVAFAVSGAVVVWSLAQAESWVFERLGWTLGVRQGLVAVTQAPPAAYLWGLFLLLAMSGVTGLLIGLTYARVGSAATLLLPLTLAPLAATAILALDPATMFRPFLFTFDGQTWGPPILADGGVARSVLLGLVLLCATSALVHLLARRMPIVHRPG